MGFETDKFVYETHLHTSQASACAKNTGREMAIAHKEAGYTGIIVTDHFVYGNTAVDRSLPWQDWVHAYCAGYRDALAIGKEIDLDVFFGWEETYEGQDFLIYGLDKEWMKAHPEMEYWTIREQFEAVDKAGGLVIHAHPFRDRPYIPKIRLFPNHVHGVEIFNAGNFPEENDEAFMYAKKYKLPVTAGSDSHHHNIVCSGIECKEKWKSINDYIKIIKKEKPITLIY